MSPDVASPSNVASGANVVSGFPGRRSAEREGHSRTESLVTPYAQLRKTLASRDRSERRRDAYRVCYVEHPAQRDDYLAAALAGAQIHADHWTPSCSGSKAGSGPGG